MSLAGLLPSDTSTGGSVQWTRELDPNTTGTVLVGYAKDTIGSGPTINASVALTRRFTETLTGGVRYDYIKGSGGIGGISVISTSGQNFTQNALTFSLQKTF
jgi:uncharacterized protein (PEP-CTERM system associated)